MLGARIKRVVPSTTFKISGLAKDLRAKGVDVIDLSIGEPDFATPEHIKQAAKQALDDNLTGYTANEGLPELRQAICDKLHRDNDLIYELDQLLVSSGAKFSCYVAHRALLEEGMEVIIPAPCWVSYPAQVRLAGGFPVFVYTRQEDGFKMRPEQLREAITENSGLLILNYPCNPTGAAYTADELAELAAICEEHDIWILADEIYEKLTYDGHQHVSVASVSPEAKERTIVINGLSKAFAMTGWRIGYAAGPREMISAMAKVQSHATSAANSIAQAAGVTALNGPQTEIERMRLVFQDRRDQMLAKLNAIEGIACPAPPGAFYLFPHVGHYLDRKGPQGNLLHSSAELAYYLLQEAHVAVVPGDAFGGKGHIRLSYSTSTDRLLEGVDRIAEALARLS